MLDLVTIYDIFTCKEMPYNNTLRSQRGAILFFVLSFFFFLAGEADSRARTCDLPINVEDTCYCAEADLLHERWIPLINFMVGASINVRGINTYLCYSESI